MAVQSWVKQPPEKTKIICGYTKNYLFVGSYHSCKELDRKFHPLEPKYLATILKALGACVQL